MTASLNLFIKHFSPTVEKLGLHFPSSSETSREKHLSQSILIYQPLLIWCSYEELTVNSIHEFIMCSITLSILIYLNRFIQNMFAFLLVTLKTAQRAPTWTPNWPNNQKSFTPPQGCKILFGQICTWRFWPSVCSHIYKQNGDTDS